MMLVLQIAAGIVMGFVILAYWRKILHVAVALLVLAAVAGVLWWANTNLEPGDASIVVLLVVAVIALAFAPLQAQHYKRDRLAVEQVEEARRRIVLTFLRERGGEATAEEILKELLRRAASGLIWDLPDVIWALQSLEKKGQTEHSGPIWRDPRLSIWRVVGTQPRPTIPKIEHVF